MSGENKPVFVRPFKEEAWLGLLGRTQRGLCSLCREQRGPAPSCAMGALCWRILSPLPRLTPELGKGDGSPPGGPRHFTPERLQAEPTAHTNTRKPLSRIPPSLALPPVSHSEWNPSLIILSQLLPPSLNPLSSPRLRPPSPPFTPGPQLL